MKIKKVFWLAAAVSFIFAGCGRRTAAVSTESAGIGSPAVAAQQQSDTENAEGSDMAAANAYQEAMEFMMTKYGFSAEELVGIDLERFIADYALRTMDYSADDVREILDEEKQYYPYDASSLVFALLGDPSDVPESGNDLPQSADITEIAYYANPGSLQRKMAFFLEEGLFYVDSAEPRVLTDEDAEKLRAIPKTTSVSSWAHRYVNSTEEEETTGSLEWKIVFLLRDGTECVYGGYTRDMTNLPEDYSAVTDVFEKIADGAAD